MVQENIAQMQTGFGLFGASKKYWTVIYVLKTDTHVTDPADRHTVRDLAYRHKTRQTSGQHRTRHIH